MVPVTSRVFFFHIVFHTPESDVGSGFLVPPRNFLFHIYTPFDRMMLLGTTQEL